MQNKKTNNIRLTFFILYPFYYQRFLKNLGILSGG
jgi:hypothetical protein